MYLMMCQVMTMMKMITISTMFTLDSRGLWKVKLQCPSSTISEVQPQEESVEDFSEIFSSELEVFMTEERDTEETGGVELSEV